MNPFLVFFESMLRLFWPAPAQPAPKAAPQTAKAEPVAAAPEPQPEPQLESPAPAVLSAPEAEAPEIQPEVAAQAAGIDPLEVLEDEDEDQFEAEEFEDEDEEGAVLVDEPLPPDPEELAAQRREAEAEALIGEHRVFPSTDAGPGTVAEALAKLEREGRVTCEFREDPEDGPYLLYKAVEPAAAAAA